MSRGMAIVPILAVVVLALLVAGSAAVVGAQPVGQSSSDFVGSTTTGSSDESGVTDTPVPDRPIRVDNSVNGNVTREVSCPVVAETPFPSTNDTDTAHSSPVDTTLTPERFGETSDPRLDAVHPNPTTEGNVGEYLVLTTPSNTSLEGWTLTDGHASAALPNVTVSGSVAITMSPNETAAITDLEPVELDGHLPLAADGDDIMLLANGTVRDAISYDRAGTAATWYRDADEPVVGGGEPATGEWWPKGASCVPARTYDGGTAEAFVLPDSPAPPEAVIEAADDRILLAGYTFESEATTDALQDALERGVDVEILVEAGPVGGTAERTDTRLSDLETAGATVVALGGTDSRYRFHHPKYAIADETVLVSSENWNTAGLGGGSSRGWGVVLEDPALAADLEAVFRADATGWDVDSWHEHRETATFVEDEPRNGSFDEHHPPVGVEYDAVELLVAPENAEPRLLELIEGAQDELLIKQAAIGGPDLSLLEAVIAAAERGVEVRILLDGSWYVEDDNRALVAHLEERAAEEALPLQARVVESNAGFEKIHAKGVVIDGETAIVGSLNWNDNALENNREVVVALHGEESAAFYADVFAADWAGGDSGPLPLPLEVVAAVAVGLVAAAVLGWHRIRFEDDPDDGVGDDERIYF